MRQIGSFSTKFLRKAGARRGFAESEILAHWQKIVPTFGQFSRPVKLWQGKLTVATNSSSAAMNMNMQTPLLIGRINQFLGYPAVDKIQCITTAFVVENDETFKPIVPNNGAKGRAKARCSEVKNDEIREVLERLGAAIEMENFEKFNKK